LVLARINAELAWAKLSLGLPVLLMLGAAAGLLADRSARGGIWVLAWTVYGVSMGVVAGGIPFLGYNLATWILEPRLWGANAYPMGRVAINRMIFAATVTGCVGTAGGAIGWAVVGKARALISAAGRTGRRSWAALLAGVPIAVLPGIACDKLINSGLRITQQVVHAAISGDRGDYIVNANTASPDVQFPTGYTLHLVGYDPEDGPTTVDVVYGRDRDRGSGFTVRCTVLGGRRADCTAISPRFGAWMDALISGELKGGQGTDLASATDQVLLGSDTPAWLATQEERINKPYDVFKDTQRGPWTLVSARFDTHDVLTCYFRGAELVVLTRCQFEP
jgi:hypothetical protein